jgi:uncharacterized protein (DUF1697 family)
MPTYVALLRGINLGPRNKIAMAELRELLRSLGHEDVRTLILSGNAVFTSRRRAIPALEREMEDAIRERFGFDIRILVRTADELAAAVAANPYPAPTGDGRIYALFLERAPDPERIAAIDPATVEPDRFALGDRVIYVSLTGGFLDSKAFAVLTDKRLGVAMTNRNWNTVVKLHALVQGDDADD